MIEPVRITPNFAVTGAMLPADFARAAALGFRSIVSNRPDGEAGALLTAQDEAMLAAGAGLAFRHIPATKHDLLSDRVTAAFARALRELPRPVLAHCASGLRSAALWAAAAALSQPADCVLERLAQAGLDLASLREEIAGRRRPLPRHETPPALDAGCAGL